MRFPSALITVPALIVGLTACAPDDAAVSAPDLDPLRVRVAEAEMISVEKPIRVQGIVQPAREAFVSSRVMGPVIAVKASSGDTVTKGATLVEIQPETSRGQVAQAEGALAQAKAALTLAERNFKRFEALHADKAASEVEFDMARMQFEQAQGAVEQAEGAVRAARAVAGETRVTAPFAARVVQRMVEVGDMAAPGRPLIRLESLEGRRLRLTIREGDIGRVELGQEIPVTLDSFTEVGQLAGTVAEIVPSADPATHTFTVKVDLGTGDVPSGVSGKAVIPGDTVDRIVIPAAAVHTRGGLELVVVKAADSTARTRAVTTGGALGDDRIEVLSGIKAGDLVVIDAPGPVADATPLEVAS